MVTALGLQARKQQHLKEGRKKLMKETINRFFDFFLFFFFLLLLVVGLFIQSSKGVKHRLQTSLSLILRENKEKQNN